MIDEVFGINLEGKRQTAEYKTNLYKEYNNIIQFISLP